MSTRVAKAPECQERWGPPSFEAIYREHRGYIRALLVRLTGGAPDADDLVQEVFVLALRKLGKLRDDNVRPWLASIAVRLAKASRRRAWLRRKLGRFAAPLDVRDWRTPERVCELNEASRKVYALLDQLSEKKRTAFVLFELQGMDGPEIAAVLGVPEKTVWSRLLHARREFLALLAKEQSVEAPQGGGKEAS